MPFLVRRSGRAWRLLVITLVCLACAAGCGGGGSTKSARVVTVVDTVEKTVGMSGGEMESSLVPDAVSLEVPSGVLSEEATVKMEVLSDVPVAPSYSGARLVGHPVSITVTGASIAQDAHIVVKSDESGDDGYAQVMGYLQDGQWIVTPVSEDGGKVSAQVILPQQTAAAQSAAQDRSIVPPALSLTIGMFRIAYTSLGGMPPMSVYRYSSGGWSSDNGNWSGSHIVLLVHGFATGSHDDLSILADCLSSDFGCQVYAVEYNEGFGIDRLGAKLASIISARTPSGGKIDIVAHSMGGLVSRSALEQHGADARVSRLITLGSPHAGVTPAFLFSALVNSVLGVGLVPELGDMCIGSGFLQALNQPSNTGCEYYAVAGSDANREERYETGVCGGVLWRLFRGDHDGLVETFRVRSER